MHSCMPGVTLRGLASFLSLQEDACFVWGGSQEDTVLLQYECTQMVP